MFLRALVICAVLAPVVDGFAATILRRGRTRERMLFSSKRLEPVSDQCTRELTKTMASVNQADAQECANREGHMEAARTALRNKSTVNAAYDLIAESFSTCLNISKNCSAAFAPAVAFKLRWDGQCVSTNCSQDMALVLSDEAIKNNFSACMVGRHVGDHLILYLQQHRLEEAISYAERGLAECAPHWLGPQCAFQVAPVLVNNFSQTDRFLNSPSYQEVFIVQQKKLAVPFAMLMDFMEQGGWDGRTPLLLEAPNEAPSATLDTGRETSRVAETAQVLHPPRARLRHLPRAKSEDDGA